MLQVMEENLLMMLQDLFERQNSKVDDRLINFQIRLH